MTETAPAPAPTVDELATIARVTATSADNLETAAAWADHAVTMANGDVTAAQWVLHMDPKDPDARRQYDHALTNYARVKAYAERARDAAKVARDVATAASMRLAAAR